MMINNKISESVSIKFADYLRERNDFDQILKLHIGEPSFEIDSKIINSAALNLKNNTYTSSRGDLELRREICKKLQKKNKIVADPNKNILITNGAIHGISIAINFLLNSDDECIIISPFWKPYESLVKTKNAKPVYYQVKIEKNFNINYEELEKLINKKTKLLILNYPNNPTGKILNDKHKMIDLVERYKFNVLSDEVYEDFVFKNSQRFSIGSIEKIKDKIISIYSFSKSYSMTGFRVGYLVANQSLINQLIKSIQYSVTCISPAYQKACVTALNSEKITDKYKTIFKKRLTYFKNNIKGTILEDKLFFPESGFYVLYNIEHLKKNSIELAQILVNDHKISFCPGIAFGENFDSFLRISVVLKNKMIDKLIEELLNFEFKKK